MTFGNDKAIAWTAWPFALLLLTPLQAASALHVPLRISAPANVPVHQWPLTVGVPMPQGLARDATELTVADAHGRSVPCQLDTVSRWDDGSVRWLHADWRAEIGEQYFIDKGHPAKSADDITIQNAPDGLTVRTGGAEYEFREGGGCFQSLHVGNDKLVDNGGDAFFVIDSQGRRGVLKGTDLKVELSGPRHAVIRIEGNYVTPDGASNAAGIVYYHFYAGLPWVKISHKQIFTQETLDLWFRDIGLDLPLAFAAATARFSTNHNDAAEAKTVPLAAGQQAVMVQRDFPHFASAASKFAVAIEADGKSTEIASGAVGGDWAEASAGNTSLGAQLPGFAEMFPKAFRVAPDHLIIKLWASEAGQDLDFRTKEIVAKYFGNDWIPADHKLAQIPNTARGAARTHDIWLYPQTGAPTPFQYGATLHEIYALPDPAWTSASGVMDRFMPAGDKRFAAADQLIEDYFDTYVTMPEKIFPNTGYIAWGRNPYASVNWQKKNGRWYPALHRLSRVLDYNFKRSVWILTARSGERKYFEWSRRNARFLHDWTLSNYDTGLKPKGWFIQGIEFDSPCFWGNFPEEMIHKGEKPEMISSVACIGYGTSEDVIQYVYDWFLTGDYHSRDAAQHYKDALTKELHGDVEKALTIVPTYVLLRPLASAYEIDRDRKLYDYGHAILERLRANNDTDPINASLPQNYWKDGEIWAAFYHYYTSTGDPLALDYAIRGARRYYRTDRAEFIHRGSMLYGTFALSYQRTHDPAYLAYLNQSIADLTQQTVTLRQRGIDIEKVNQAFDKEWGHGGAMITAVPSTIGMSVALRTLAENQEPQQAVPSAKKAQPTDQTYLLFSKTKPGPARIDIYINNYGDTAVQPRLFDIKGKPVSFKIVQREDNRPPTPNGEPDYQGRFNSFFIHYGTHHYFQLETEAKPGVYRLDAGNDVAFTVLYSDIPRWLQVAPGGMPIEAEHRYYFVVPPGTTSVETFMHRRLKIIDPAGQEAPLERVDAGRYRFATGGKSGTWQLEAAPDNTMYGYPYTKPDTFVRFLNIPLVVASDYVARLFPIDAALYTAPPAPDRPADTANPVYVDGKFGRAMFFNRGRFVEVEVDPQQMPRAEGTIEFWFRPYFSSTDLNLEEPKDSYHRQQLFCAEPILIEHDISPVDNGVNGRYNQSKLVVSLLKQRGLVQSPSVLYLRAGKWYHIAVTWKVDGKDSGVELFVNGHRTTYDDYHDGISRALQVDDLAPPAETLRIGHAVTYSYFPEAGEVFDDVRVSRVVRYHDDFTPPAQPAPIDADTVVRLAFDDSLNAEVAGPQVVGEVRNGGKMKK